MAVGGPVPESLSAAPRPGASRSPRRASAIPDPPAGSTTSPAPASSIVSASSRSTRSTCWSAPRSSPLFARLGPHRSRPHPERRPRPASCSSTGPTRRRTCPMALHPLLRWQMRRAAYPGETWGGVARIWPAGPGLRRSGARGGRVSGSADRRPARRPRRRAAKACGAGAAGKRALEFLFWTGQITARRGRQFERWYDLPERVIPADVLATPDAARARGPARAPGARRPIVSASAPTATWPTTSASTCRRPAPRIAELVEEGRLIPVERAGLEGPDLPASRRATASLGPGSGSAVAVRLADLGAGPDRAAVRDAVPARDLRAAAEADLRLLRPAVPAR